MLHHLVSRRQMRGEYDEFYGLSFIIPTYKGTTISKPVTYCIKRNMKDLRASNSRDLEDFTFWPSGKTWNPSTSPFTD